MLGKMCRKMNTYQYHRHKRRAYRGREERHEEEEKWA
jgi:hypothetical protein